MDRRKFLIGAGLIGASLIILNRGVNNAVLYSPEELERKELFSLNLSSLEKTIMAGELLAEQNPIFLIDLHKEMLGNLKILEQIEKMKEDISDKIIKYSNEFAKKRPSQKDFEEKTREIDELASEIYALKKGIKINLSRFKRNVFVSINDKDEVIEFGESGLKELYTFDNYLFIALSQSERSEYNPGIKRIDETLKKMSSDSSSILEASKISGIPIGKIVAFSDIESSGNEFAIGRDGEINRFQFNPKYLKDIYNNALSINNQLSDFINENTKPKTLLEDIARNSKLNIAMAVNLMKYLEENTNESYESVIAYNLGISRTSEISLGARTKLRNPEKITPGNLKRYNIYRYYTNFLNAKRSFDEIKNRLSREIKA